MGTSILSAPVYQPPKNPLDAFDPNNRPSPFATYAPGRRPTWKLHATRASALGAMNNQRGYGGCSLYAWESNKWVEKVRYQPRDFLPSRCDACSQTLLVDEMKWDYTQNPTQRVKTGRQIAKGHQVFERERHGRTKIATPLNVLTLCDGCKQGMGY